MTVCALDPQEAVGGVADPGGQNLVPEHGIDHGALAVARPVRGYRPSGKLPIPAFQAPTVRLPARKPQVSFSVGAQVPRQAEQALGVYENRWTNASGLCP